MGYPSPSSPSSVPYPDYASGNLGPFDVAKHAAWLYLTSTGLYTLDDALQGAYAWGHAHRIRVREHHHKKIERWAIEAILTR